MRARGHGKHIIQLLEGALLRLRHEDEDEAEGREIEPRVESEGADRVEGVEQGGEGDGEHGGPEEAGCDRPGHADFTVG